jgi:hypothetical protein
VREARLRAPTAEAHQRGEFVAGFESGVQAKRLAPAMHSTMTAVDAIMVQAIGFMEERGRQDQPQEGLQELRTPVRPGGLFASW